MALEDDGRWTLATLRERDEAYVLAQAYYAGRHRLRFATERWHNAFGDTFRAFADNLCEAIVDAYTDRLQIRGFDVQDPAGGGEGGEAAETAAQRALDALWRDNRMATQSGLVHHDAVCSGDSYVVVWRPEPRGGGPVVPAIYPQSPRHMAVQYDEEIPGRATFAGKAWRQRDGRVRLTLYYRDRLERYITRGRSHGGIPSSVKAFVGYTEDDLGEVVSNTWDVIPVFHFANALGVGQAGRSVLRSPIPLQDALNKAVLDMLISMEYVSYPQRWASGIEAGVDPVTGKEGPKWRPGPERVWVLESEEARVGQLEQGDLRQHVAVQESLRDEVARVSGVPRHLLLGAAGADWPSGEALRISEARLVKRVEDWALAWGPTWSEVVRLAVRMSSVAEVEQVETLWVPAETKQERAQAETGEIKVRLGASKAQVLRELGYDDAQRERMAEERAEEGEEAARRFAAGGM